MVLFSHVLLSYLFEVSSSYVYLLEDLFIYFCFTFLIHVLEVGSSVPKGMNLRMQDTLFKELILTVNRGCLTVE